METTVVPNELVVVEKLDADVEHRRAINQEIVLGLIEAGLSEKQAQKVIVAVVGGMVKHVSIKY